MGVNYHATSSDFASDSFVSRYHHVAVRSSVVRQLQAMADMGADVVKTSLWFAADPSHTLDDSQAWLLHFPPTATELANLAAYVHDVGRIRSERGTPLRLELAMFWLACANYWYRVPPLTGADDELIGRRPYCFADGRLTQLTWGAFKARVKATMVDVLEAVGVVRRPDGSHVVSLVHAEGEVRVPSKVNQKLFLTEIYPFFRMLAHRVGVRPSLYFEVSARESAPSAQWLVDTVTFMREHAVPLPPRIDFSLYPYRAVNPWTPATDAGAITRTIMRDIKTRLLPLTGPVTFGIAETLYPVVACERAALGAALADEAARDGLIDQIVFWVTPSSIGPGYLAAPPFDFAAYRAALPRWRRLLTMPRNDVTPGLRPMDDAPPCWHGSSEQASPVYRERP